MARPRKPLDQDEAPDALRAALQAQPPGWQRERLLAVKLGLDGGRTLAEIAASVGRARSTVQLWFDAYRAGGVPSLLEKDRAQGPESRLPEWTAARLRGEWLRNPRRSGRDGQRLLAKWGVQVALSTVYAYLARCGVSPRRLRAPAVRKGTVRRAA